MGDVIDLDDFEDAIEQVVQEELKVPRRPRRRSTRSAVSSLSAVVLSDDEDDDGEAGTGDEAEWQPRADVRDNGAVGADDGNASESDDFIVDDDEEEEGDGGDDDDDFEDMEIDEDNDGNMVKRKTKRKRRGSGAGSDASARTERYRNRRRKIADVIDDDELENATIRARAAEQARMARSGHLDFSVNANPNDPDAEPTAELLCLNPLPDGSAPTDPVGSPDQPVFVHPSISGRLKKHQIIGARFLWSHIAVEPDGFGCVLADFMGLGKTLQVITTVQAFMALQKRNGAGELEPRHKHALILAPTICVRNWEAEVVKWLGRKEARRLGLRTLESSREKKMTDRVHVVKQWYKRGGVLIMGYELYRLLVLQASGDEKIAAGNAQHTRAIKEIYTCLSDPGPDLIVLDEGHRVRDHKSKLVKALSHVKTARRIILTGYPLQNHMEEYWTMVNFARPDFLGSLEEFKNRFVDPIENGQCIDSSEADLRLARQRAYVLTRELKPLVLRRDQQYLFSQLPPKKEWVLFCKMTELQAQLYRAFLTCGVPKRNELMPGVGGKVDVLGGYHISLAISNHPDVLNETYRKLEEDRRSGKASNAARNRFLMAEVDEDMDFDFFGQEASNDTNPTPSQSQSRVIASATSNSSDDEESLLRALDAPSSSIAAKSAERAAHSHRLSFAADILRDYRGGKLDDSGKMMILMSLLVECQQVGDRVIIFSQSIPTLNTIERMVALTNKRQARSSRQRLTFLRIDGSTSQQERFRQIEQFNDPEEDVDMILISTKAGGEGINLCAGNRIIIFDVCWNPCNDSQSMCRSYRFGQTKPVFVYRFVSVGTMEKKVYDLQIRKEGVAKRIVDEKAMERKFKSADLQNYFNLDEFEQAYAQGLRMDDPAVDDQLRPPPDEDPVFQRVLAKFQGANLEVNELSSTSTSMEEDALDNDSSTGGRWIMDWFEQETMFEEDLDQQCSPREQEEVVESYRYIKAMRKLRNKGYYNLSREGLKKVQCKHCNMPNDLFPEAVTKVKVPNVIECLYCKQPTSTANAVEAPPMPVYPMAQGHIGSVTQLPNGRYITPGMIDAAGAVGLPGAAGIPSRPLVAGPTPAVDVGSVPASAITSQSDRVLPPHLLALFRQQRAEHEAREQQAPGAGAVQPPNRAQQQRDQRMDILRRQFQLQQAMMQRRSQVERSSMTMKDRHILVLRRGMKGCQELKRQAEACGSTMAIEVSSQLTDIVSAMSPEETLKWLKLNKLPRDVELHDDNWLRAEIAKHNGQGSTANAPAPDAASSRPAPSKQPTVVRHVRDPDSIELLDSEDEDANPQNAPQPSPTTAPAAAEQRDDDEDSDGVIEIL